MKIQNRVNEIVTSMKSFSKDSYRREELLPELLDLQRELVHLTFNGEHAESGRLRIWDVENHLEKLNEERGHPLDSALGSLKESCKIICSTIKAEYSGLAGETKAFKSLETVRCSNTLLKNTEFNSGDRRTEIDAIVFTKKAVFLVEVKNTGRNVLIDERGNYYRDGLSLVLDCNIGEKMNIKEYLLREAIKNTGIDIMSPGS